MSLPRLDLLINSGRILSLSRDYGDSHGIDQQFFIEAANKALLLVQQEVVNSLAETYTKYKTYTITSQTERLALPSDIFIDDLVYEVRYSPTGNRRDLEDPLQMGYVRGTNEAGAPEWYVIQNGYLYLSPEPTTGFAEIRYEGFLPRVDLRRGTILSTAGTMPSLTSIELADDDNFDSNDWLTTPEYVSIVDWYGNVLAKAVEVESFDTGTRTITVRSAYVAEDGETAPSGAYICFGKNASSHLHLPKPAELFVLQFMQDEVNDLLSSDDQAVTLAKQDAYLKKLVTTYEMLPAGPKRTAYINKEGI